VGTGRSSAFLTAGLADGGVDSQEWVVIVYTAVGAIGVYVVPNLSTGVGRFAKGALSRS
jgi:hypothetical protein